MSKAKFLLWLIAVILLMTLCACDRRETHETETTDSTVLDTFVTEGSVSEESQSEGEAVPEESLGDPTDQAPKTEPEEVTDGDTPNDTAVSEEETTSPVVELPKVEFD